jgi:amidase
MSRLFPVAALLIVVATIAAVHAQNGRKPSTPRKAFTVVETTIPEMRLALEQGRTTSRQIVQQYLTRIATYEDRLHAAITVNPKALDIADERDRERAAGKIRGPLHGIPIALKDNIHTTDMRTTGGALAFENLTPPYEATLTRNLRDAGAIIIAKTGMTELANWVAGAPTPMPGNYNGLAGYGYNPYDPRRDPREATFDGRPALGTGGSSSGVGTGANFWAGNVGTETSGSVLSPSTRTCSRHQTHSRPDQPLRRDPDHRRSGHARADGEERERRRDHARRARERDARSQRSRHPHLPAAAEPRLHEIPESRGPQGRAHRYSARVLLRARNAAGTNRGTRRVERRSKEGDGRSDRDPEEAGRGDCRSADIPSILDKDAKNNLMLWNTCSGANEGKGKDADCSVAFKYGMKRDFNIWLTSLGAAAPLKTLTALRDWNVAHQKAGAIKYGQSNLDVSDEMDLNADRARYDADRAKDIRLGGAHGIDEIMKAERLDAILFPGAGGAAISAKPGYPTVIVPFALVPNAPTPPFPAGFDARPGPFGVSFAGGACSEPKLIGLAYAFEQASKKRVPPPLFP